MGVNRVLTSTGDILIDISDATITPETIPEGFVGYNAQGERIVGTMKICEPFYIDCTLNIDGNVYEAVATSDTPTQAEVDTAFSENRPIYLRWADAGVYVFCTARTPDGSGGFVYTFLIIVGDTTSTVQFLQGRFYNSSFVAQEKIAVVSDESEVQDGKITIVV